MAGNERLIQFPEKTTPVLGDIVYFGDSQNMTTPYNEVYVTLQNLITAYENSAVEFQQLTLNGTTNQLNFSTGLVISAPTFISPLTYTLPDAQANAQFVLSTSVNSIGGIYYSTAHSAAILNGTMTARQLLMSGSAAAPVWSSATYPATSTINQLLYSSANNTIVGLATATNSVLITDNTTGIPSLSQTLPSAVQGNITIAESQVTNLVTDLAGKQPLNSSLTQISSGTWAGASSITTVGTIGTGVWQGTVISPVYGGTGVNNGTSTITLAGSLTLAGAFTSQFTFTANTSVIFPTTGTLTTTAALAGYLPLTGGTLTGGLIGTSATFVGAVNLNSTGTAVVNIGNNTAPTTVSLNGTININQTISSAVISIGSIATFTGQVNIGGNSINITSNTAGTITIGDSLSTINIGTQGTGGSVINIQPNVGNSATNICSTSGYSGTLSLGNASATVNVLGTVNIGVSGSSTISIGAGSTGVVNIGGNSINVTANSTGGVAIGNALNSVYLGSQGSANSVINMQPGTGAGATNIGSTSGYSGTISIGNASATVNILGSINLASSGSQTVNIGNGISPASINIEGTIGIINTGTANVTTLNIASSAGISVLKTINIGNNNSTPSITNINGTINIGGTTTFTNLTASQAVVTNASKQLVSLAYTSANTASTLVQRDGSGNFSAGTITATLTGHSSLDVPLAGNVIVTGQIIFITPTSPPIGMESSTAGAACYQYFQTSVGRQVFVGIDGSTLANIQAGSLILATDNTGNLPVYITPGTSSTYGLKIASGSVVSTFNNLLDGGSGAATFAGLLTATGGIAGVLTVNPGGSSVAPLIIATSNANSNSFILQANGSNKITYKWDASNGIQIQDSNNSTQWLYQGSTTPGAVRSNNNIFDNGSGAATFAGLVTATASVTIQAVLSMNSQIADNTIRLYDGGSAATRYGFGIQGGQLVYSVATNAHHNFYVGGSGGTLLLTLDGVSGATICQKAFPWGVTTITTPATGNQTITAAQLLGGIVLAPFSGSTVSWTWTTDNGTNIYTAMGSPATGTTFKVLFSNGNNAAVTINLAYGSNVTGATRSNVISNNSSMELNFRCTGTNTFTVYS